MTIDELISALEKAEGPNMELDKRVFALINGREWYRSTFEQYEPSEPLPKYSASLDAALTLVPDGFTVHTIHHGTKQWDVSLCIVGDCGLASWDADHESLPIAICIAALKARRNA